MNFKLWLLNEEIHSQNNTATVYHRTCPRCDEENSVKSVSSILTSYFKPAKGCMYGCGLYTTYKIESQFTSNMQGYGKAVVKFKVTDLDKYLIFELSEAKKIHGNDYKISDQLNKLGVLNQVKVDLKQYDERQEKENFSSDLAVKFYKENTWIENSIKGIIYYGANDGYCLLKYPKVEDGTIKMLGYAVAKINDMKKMEELKSNIGWIKSVGFLGTPIKSAYNSPDKMKEKFAFGDNKYVVKYLIDAQKANKLELRAEKLEPEYMNKLSDSNVRYFISSANNKEKMAEIIINKKTKLSDDNVKSLLSIDEVDQDKIAEYIIKKQPELSNINVSDLLLSANKKDEIAELIIKYKTELSNDNVFWLLLKANKKEEIAELLQKETDNISKLSYGNVAGFFYHVTDKKQMAQIINKYHTKKTPEIQKEIDKYLTQTIAAK